MFWQWLANLVGKLPWSTMATFGRGLGWLVGSALRIRRRHTEAALARAGFASPSTLAKRVYANLGTNVFELLWTAGQLPRGSQRPINVRVLGWQRVERALEAGRGIVVATAHTGNWDMAACAMADRLPLSVVTKHLSWRSLDRFWQSLRARRGVELVDASGALKMAKGALRRGRAVAFLIDQAPRRSSGVHTGPFLGANAEHDATFAIVAARYGAPIVLALPRRRRDGKHEVVVHDVLEPPEAPSSAWIRATTLHASATLEAEITAHPEQWLWLHRRWRGCDEASTLVLQETARTPSARKGETCH